MYPFRQTATRNGKNRSLRRPWRNEEGPSFDLNDHLDRTSPALSSAFLVLRTQLLSLSGVQEVADQKLQITYVLRGRSLASFAMARSRIVCNFHFAGRLEDPAAKDIRLAAKGYEYQCVLRVPADVPATWRLLQAASKVLNT